MNLWDILILAGIAAAVRSSLRYLRRNAGKGCTGNCADCISKCGK